jgi:hypothetical protein
MRTKEDKEAERGRMEGSPWYESLIAMFSIPKLSLLPPQRRISSLDHVT